MAITTSWKPLPDDSKGKMPAYVYAFPRQRIDPLVDVFGIRTALEHLHSVSTVSDAERTRAFENIKKAAKHFHLEISGDSFEETWTRPQVEVVPCD